MVEGRQRRTVGRQREQRRRAGRRRFRRHRMRSARAARPVHARRPFPAMDLGRHQKQELNPLIRR